MVKRIVFMLIRILMLCIILFTISYDMFNHSELSKNQIFYLAIFNGVLAGLIESTYELIRDNNIKNNKEGD